MLQFLMMIGVAALVPALCFGLLFWLAWLEDTMVDDLRSAGSRRVPEPIYAIAVPPTNQSLKLVQTFPRMIDAEVAPVSVAQIPASPDVVGAAATA